MYYCTHTHTTVPVAAQHCNAIGCQTRIKRRVCGTAHKQKKNNNQQSRIWDENVVWPISAPHKAFDAFFAGAVLPADDRRSHTTHRVTQSIHSMILLELEKLGCPQLERSNCASCWTILQSWRPRSAPKSARNRPGFSPGARTYLVSGRQRCDFCLTQ